MANHFRKPGSHRYHKSGVRPALGQTYPDQVRALLFVDSFPVEIRTLMGADWPAYPSC